MTETRGSRAKVKWDQPKDRLDPAQFDKDVRRLLELIVELRPLWEDAVDGGVYAPKTGSNGRGTGFDDVDPTHSAVVSPTRRQLRTAARRASTLMNEAVSRLDEAERVLQNGLLRTDPEVLGEFLEKRSAAIQR